MQKILIIGNGFDLAHNLTTNYRDFLGFVQLFESYYSRLTDIAKRGAIFGRGRQDLDCIRYLLLDDPGLGNRLHSLITNNIWIEYFNQLNAEGERWIDFEAEIEKVIISIDRSISSNSSSRNIERIGNPFFQAFVDKKKAEMNSQHIDTGEPVYSYDALLSLLKNDFIRITDALEIYLFIYIERFGWNSYKAYNALPSFDKVLSFNYTDTYMRLYDPVGVVLFGMATDSKIGVSTSESMTSMYAKYCYVHGKVRDGKGNYFPDSNRHIILGISDEDDTKDKIFINNEKKYHDFQKYILRERYGEKNYVEWLKEIKESSPCELHIIGHSLAFSDRDILVPFLTHQNVSTTIYYLDDDKLNDLKENLHDLIGKKMFKELCNTRISFKPVSQLT